MPKLRLLLRSRQLLERTNVMLRGAGCCGDGLSSARHGDPTVDENSDIFFEAFCLFITSEPVNIFRNDCDTEVHEYLCR
jgi:hypothetical protein